LSTPRRVQLDSTIRVGDIETARGTFAGFGCSPTDSSLPRGNVLLVPGFTGSKEDFAEILPLLKAAGWQSATYDQRGQYESVGTPDDDFSLDGLAADLIAVVEALFGHDEQTHLVGHSFGGLVASAAVLAQPDRFATLTLLCSGPGGFTDAKAAEALAGAELIEHEGMEAAYVSRERRTLDRAAEPPSEEVAAFLRTRFMANSPQSLAAMARLLAETGDLTSALVDSPVPVSVVRGADDDAWAHDVQDELADALGTRVVVIDDAAHSPAVEQPEPTRDALARIWMSRRG